MARRVIGWEADRYTGDYPITRVAWHVLVLPIFVVTLFAFLAATFLMSGVDGVQKVWREVW